MNNPLVYWLRKDLRVSDNPTLTAAVKTGKPILAVYVLDQNPDDKWAMGAASRWWLHHSLTSLQRSLSKLRIQLVLRKGPVIIEIDSVLCETKADALYFSRMYEPYEASVEQQIFEQYSQHIEVKRFRGYLLHEPETIRTGNGSPYKVFTPFYKAWQKQPQPQQPLTGPAEIRAYNKKVTGQLLQEWGLLPAQPDWAAQFTDIWQPGESGAQKQLNSFITQSSSKYSILRNRPDVSGTSRLSAYLHFGEISPRQIWNAVQNHHKIPDNGETYLRQLIWREFSYHLLANWPDLPDQAFKPEFNKFRWQQNNTGLIAWQRGQTGYPIVDAGMRELWKTGWMHNRVRMIVASFLVKDLLIPWQLGESWFWDTLVDANLANNASGWQWVAGCGADAAPYFRIFNPVLQGQKFDPKGDYVRTWVPELKSLPVKYIHSPWLAPQSALASARIELGKQYPYPIVDHSEARDRALRAHQALKK